MAERGKVVRLEGVDLPEGRIEEMENYKYLGIPHTSRNNDGEARKAATTKYLSRVRYSDGIKFCPQEEIDAINVRTGKLLTIHEGFHPKSSTLRLNELRMEGRLLQSVCGY